MTMQSSEDDSQRSKTMIERGREITKLVKEAVTADRSSRSFRETNANSVRAAQNRNEAIEKLRKSLLAFGEEL